MMCVIKEIHGERPLAVTMGDRGVLIKGLTRKVMFVRTVDIVDYRVLKLVGIFWTMDNIALCCQEVFRSADKRLA